jgi:hypothetical protein
MGNFLDISNYTIYKILTDDDLLVAVSSEYTEQIERMVEEYGSIKNIPSSKTVRGIFINRGEKEDLKMVITPMQENDVTVNQLRPID